MFYQRLFFMTASTANAWLLSHALLFNERHNEFLSSLSHEQKEKLAARNWALRKYGYFFDSGCMVAKNYEINRFEQMPEQDKEHILDAYRMSQAKRF